MRGALPVLCLALAALACGEASAPESAPGAGAEASAPPTALAKIRPGPHDVAVLEMGALGSIRIELLPELAPDTVARFSALAESGFYDGTYFHRVIPGFMIQGGDPYTKNLDPRDDGRGNSGDRVHDEFSDYPHTRGTVSMANTGHPNSASSQFFIVHQDTPSLDGHYSVFGRVVEGMQTVDAVTELAIDEYGRYGPKDRPYPVNATIEHLRIEHAQASEAPATRTAANAHARPGEASSAP